MRMRGGKKRKHCGTAIYVIRTVKGRDSLGRVIGSFGQSNWLRTSALLIRCAAQWENYALARRYALVFRRRSPNLELKRFEYRRFPSATQLNGRRLVWARIDALLFREWSLPLEVKLSRSRRFPSIAQLKGRRRACLHFRMHSLAFCGGLPLTIKRSEHWRSPSVAQPSETRFAWSRSRMWALGFRI